MPLEPQNFVAGFVSGAAIAIFVGFFLVVRAMESGAGWLSRHKKATGIAYAGVWSSLWFDIGRDDIVRAHVHIEDGWIVEVYDAPGCHSQVGGEGGDDPKTWIKVRNDAEQKAWEETW